MIGDAAARGGAIVLALAVTLCGPVAAGTLSIVNGDFELGTDPGESFTRFYAGSSDIAGWTIIGTSVDYVGGYWDASSGVRWVELDGDFGEAGGVQQAVATVPGETYAFRFEMAGLPVLGPPYTKTMQVQAGGSVVDYEFSVVGKSADNMGWETHTFAFTAISTTTTIRFISTNDPPGIGPAIDNVRDASTVAAEAASWGAIKALFHVR